MKHFAVFLSLFLTLNALAEYRVFTLHITDDMAHTTKQVETTLDPDQYKDVFPLKYTEKISYIETWKCLGRTDFFKAHCDNPRLRPDLDRHPASQSPEVLK